MWVPVVDVKSPWRYVVWKLRVFSCALILANIERHPGDYRLPSAILKNAEFHPEEHQAPS
jgi:hypothetical protein